jgi:site-specific recombinase XerD
LARLYRHKQKGWQIHFTLYFPDGTARRKYRYFHNRALAERSLRDIDQLEYNSLKSLLTRDDLTLALRCRYLSQEEAARILNAPVTSPLLGELAQVFLARSEIECRPRSHTVNKIRVEHLLAFFGGECPATGIIRERIEAFRASRLSGSAPLFASQIKKSEHVTGRGIFRPVTPTTINKEIIKLAQLLDIALERGAIAQNPARKIKRLRDLRERKPRALTKDEITRLLEAAQAEKKLFRGLAYEVISTYLYTGMRREELIWLEWEDVDLERRKITIQAKAEFKTKSGKARIVGIASTLAGIIATLPRTGRYVFGGTSHSSPARIENTKERMAREVPFMKGDGVGHAFRKLVKKSGLPDTITLHSLRHTYITHLMEAGVNPRRVQELAGHGDMSTTWRYAHTLPSHEIDEDRLEF